MSKRLVMLAVLGAVIAAGVFAWRQRDGGERPRELVIHGNVDFRQASLAFNSSERIEAVLVEEGQRVRRGQVLARVERPRLEAQVAAAEADAAAQRAVLQRLQHGTRPEEVAQARAQVAAAEAEVTNAQQEYDRLVAIAASFEGRAISEREVQDARAVLVTAEAALEVSRRGLALAEAGPRVEEIEQAAAQLQAQEARLRLQRQQLRDAELLAPADGVIRARLMEPGEMASPQRPVYSLAVTDPKWVRAYVAEPDLGRVRPGMAAAVETDWERSYQGWVGFISPVAEFTPKPVQTEALRPSLVYEVRVFVHDPADELRLGTPATVRLEETVTTPATQPVGDAEGS